MKPGAEHRHMPGRPPTRRDGETIGGTRKKKKKRPKETGLLAVCFISISND